MGVEGTDADGQLLVGLQLGLLWSVQRESLTGISLSALLFLLALSLKVLQCHFHFSLPSREIILLQHYFIFISAFPVTAPTLGCSRQFS